MKKHEYKRFINAVAKQTVGFTDAQKANPAILRDVEKAKTKLTVSLEPKGN